MKTNKSIKKRVHFTKGGKGKAMMQHVGVRHGKTKLSSKTKRRKRLNKELPKAISKKLKTILPYDTN